MAMTSSGTTTATSARAGRCATAGCTRRCPGLARDGKAVAGPAEQGAGPERRRYAITEAGTEEVHAWLSEPTPPEPDLQSGLFAKVVIALLLGQSADQYLDAQRAAHLQRMRELTQLKQQDSAIDVL